MLNESSAPKGDLPGYILPPGGARRRPKVPALARIVVLLLAIVAVWVVGDFAYVTVGAETDYAAHADVIILLGCNPASPDGGPSECIKARSDHAAALYRQGLAAHVIATGGSSDRDDMEAEIMARVLESDGVPQTAIVKEERAQNTIQNISYSAEIMQSRGWHSAILVTEPYHIKRSTLIARDAGLQVYPSPAVGSPIWQNTGKRYLKLVEDTFSLILYQLKVAAGVKD